MKRLSFLVLTSYLLLLLASCSGTFDKVVQSYDDGSPMLVYTYKGSEEKPTLVAEKMFYQNGQLQFEKHFTGQPEQPDGVWKYYFDNGQMFASADFSKERQYGKDWKFYNRNGDPYYDAPLDSVYVTDMGMFGTPSTVVFCSGVNHDVIQFFSNYTVRSSERLVNGVRNGRVMFYHPNGMPQAEAYFVNGLEEGSYTVYQSNGIPYYRGTYSQGVRTGQWEFYDEEGNLVETRVY